MNCQFDDVRLKVDLAKGIPLSHCLGLGFAHVMEDYYYYNVRLKIVIGKVEEVIDNGQRRDGFVANVMMWVGRVTDILPVTNHRDGVQVGLAYCIAQARVGQVDAVVVVKYIGLTAAVLRNTMNYYLDGCFHLLAWEEDIQTRVDASRQVRFASVTVLRNMMMTNLRFDTDFRLAREEGMLQTRVDAS